MTERATEAWATFVAAPETLGPTPGAREAWHRGRRAYAVWVLRVTDPAVRARAHAVTETLRPHGVRPLGELHITVFVAGFPAQTPRFDDDVDADLLLAPIPELPRRAPRLWVGGASAFQSCPFLTIADPFEDLEVLRAPLAARHPEIRFAPYVPHLTLGTFTDSRPTGPVAVALGPHLDLPLLPLTAQALELVTFDPADPFVRFTPLARVPFDG